MQPRLNYQEAAPEVRQAMQALSAAAKKGFAPELIDLIDYRVSQINGCAFCLDMHAKDFRARGGSEQRLYMVSAWREAAHLYSDRERAALAWTEAVTRLADNEVPDSAYEEARAQFSEAELVQLTLAIVTINGWNRLNIAFRTPAGDYQSPVKRSAA